MDSLCLSIIELLKQKEYLTSEAIGKVFSVSERTIRNRIKEMNEQLIQNGAVINSVRGLGFHLEIINEEIFSDWLKSNYEKQENIPNTSEERVNYLIDFLLNQEDYIYIDDLCDQLYVSRNTISADLKRVEKELATYSLFIERRPNYGIRINGQESNKRLCIIKRVSHHSPYFVDKLKEEGVMIKLADALSKSFHAHSYTISIENYQMIKYTIYVAYQRCLNGFSIQFEKDEKEQIIAAVGQKIIAIVDNILDELSGDFDVLKQSGEVLYIATQIAGRGTIDKMNEDYYREDCNLIALNMLQVIKEGLKIDLCEDKELFEALKNHLSAFDIRMKYAVSIENPLISMIKHDHSVAYALAYFSGTYLENYYGKPLSPDEIGFIAILFALSLEKRKQPIRKKNVALLLLSGNSMNHFFIQKFKNYFSDYLNELYQLSYKELSEFDFEGKQIDFCLTTNEVAQAIAVPCYPISMFPSDGELIKIKNLFIQPQRKELLQFYKPELFIPHLSAANKREAVEKMVSFINKVIPLPDDFANQLLLQDSTRLSDIRSLMVTLRTNECCSEETFVSVAILDKPLLWDKHYVHVITIISLAKNAVVDTTEFIRATSDFLYDEKRVLSLVKNRNFEQLMNLLTKQDEH